ncbi:hypothetical protein PAMC26510_09745 [Caballeronia sordidicola]|uniref:Uncharacterized protein n=1 Tax=Caballeronia sordidicola TaxID=196367 RepID=A0A242MRT0_CABSO|nr:hypothetical protein PAMC26577_17565 [Caballeronia sordidicola]OTP76674.1 hypothetical protein PAMC26510_09745 [Caballeronia sordidicola]
MDLRFCFICQQLRQDVRGRARDYDYLDVVGLFEVREHLAGVGLFHRATVHSYVYGLGFCVGGDRGQKARSTEGARETR